MAWNSNAFFCRDVFLQQKRTKRVVSWLQRNDFVILPEAHASQDRVDRWNSYYLRLGMRAYAAPPPEREKEHSTAGVVLILSSRLEKQFTRYEFRTILPGHAGILTLSGPNGWLQIIALYGPLPKATSRGRMDAWKDLGEAVLPPEHALVWMTGDINLVLHKDDAWNSL